MGRTADVITKLNAQLAAQKQATADLQVTLNTRNDTIASLQSQTVLDDDDKAALAAEESK